ncbi:MAG TPA: DUF3037 domain-containing protein [Candidatus Sulfotelmatobacter sp.]|jgi:hypothetical protein
MADRRQLEFFLLRYVPDAVKGEFVNFGVLTFNDEPNGAAFADVRFARDWRRVRCMDPHADVEVLEALIREIRSEVGQIKDQATLLKKMEDSFSNVIQLSGPMQVLAELPAVEIETLASMYVYESPVAGASRVPTGRHRILAAMRDAFERAGVAKMLQPVPVAPYTKVGDPFQFDMAYNTGRELKIFHAVSLKANVEGAVTLAARYPRILPVMAAKTSLTPTLTAVIDDDLDRGQDAIQFALSMMEEERIRIAVAAEMPMIAEVARRELGV